MERSEENKLKTLKEIVSDLSEEIDNKKFQEAQSCTNIFESSQSKTEESLNINTDHKINNLESEFYAPNTAETVFSDDILLEQKIIQLKKDLETINNKINAEKTYENNGILNILISQKVQTENDLKYAIKEYKKIPALVKIKNKMFYAVKFLVKCLCRINIFTGIQDNDISADRPVWKKNLQKLNSINNEINEIIKTNTPFGEQDERYERLSKSLNKALELRNNINKEI